MILTFFLWLVWGLLVPILAAVGVGYLLRRSESETQQWIGAVAIVAAYLLWMYHLEGFPPTLLHSQTLVLCCMCLALGAAVLGAAAVDWSNNPDDDAGEAPLNLSEANR